MSKVHLFSARACPYAHRTRLVLGEKSVPFELTEIDLQNKPAWFASVSVYGKVPAIEHGGRRLVESAIINEYLDEVFPFPEMLPRDPGERAAARIWIDFANTRLVTAWSSLLRAPSLAEQAKAKGDLDGALKHIEKEVFSRRAGAGRYWLGHEPSLVDFAFYPWFERWPALTHYREYVIPHELEGIHRWRDEVASRAAVRAIANPDQFYIERFAKFAVADAPRSRPQRQHNAERTES